MKIHFDTNKKNWNERVGIHKKSELYDVKGNEIPFTLSMKCMKE